MDALALVGDLAAFRRRIREVSRLIPVLAGFDFPIGVPKVFDQKTGAGGFPDLLRFLDGERWARFSSVAQELGEIAIEWPFYLATARSGVRSASLVAAHGVEAFDDLLRVCERSPPTRRAACPLFWTLWRHPGRAPALSGWEGMLRR